jgi:hypothetical protein
VLSDTEADKYRRIWERPEYRERSPGLRQLKSALRWMKPPAGASITDWGCGTGAAAEALARQGFDVRCMDITRNAYHGDLPFWRACLWELPEAMPATEYGYCADVMEHLPPEHVQRALDGIAARTTQACYFQIALFDDTMGDLIGERLHLSVFPPQWWKRRLLRAFRHVDSSVQRGMHLLAVARP